MGHMVGVSVGLLTEGFEELIILAIVEGVDM